MARITRRQALTGAAAPLLVKSRTAFGSQASSAVSFGIIGTGGRGRFVGRLMTQDPRARLAAICDIRPERIDAAQTEIPGADKVKSYRDMKDLLARADIDAVLIATPVYLHPEHFEIAAAAGKHIYIEKPAGVDVAGVKRLLRAAERLGPAKTVGFGFQQRFSPEYLAAERMIRSGQLGEMTLMISYWIWGGSAFTPAPGPNVRPTDEMERIRQWGRWKDTCGDFIVEQDCHGVDILNWFALAHPEKAYGDGGRYKRTAGDNSDHVNVSYIYPGGLRGWLLGTQLPPRAYWDVKEQFFGTQGVIEVARSYYSWQEAGKNKATRVDSKREITVDAVEAFFKSIADKKPFSMVKDAADSTLTSILGRMAVELRREVSWDEMMRGG